MTFVSTQAVYKIFITPLFFNSYYSLSIKTKWSYYEITFMINKISPKSSIFFWQISVKNLFFSSLKIGKITHFCRFSSLVLWVDKSMLSTTISKSSQKVRKFTISFVTTYAGLVFFHELFILWTGQVLTKLTPWRQIRSFWRRLTHGRTGVKQSLSVNQQNTV